MVLVGVLAVADRRVAVLCWCVVVELEEGSLMVGVCVVVGLMGYAVVVGIGVVLVLEG